MLTKKQLIESAITKIARKVLMEFDRLKHDDWGESADDQYNVYVKRNGRWGKFNQRTVGKNEALNMQGRAEKFISGVEDVEIISAKDSPTFEKRNKVVK